MSALRCTRLALAAAIALLATPAGAAADADPPSDVLLTTDAYYPYKPVSKKLVHALDSTISRARAAGFPIKVALIASRTDLGGVPGLFDDPQRYAEFLRTEISFNSKPRLLVVMPAGLGLAGAGPPSAVSRIEVESAGGPDGLARTALRAVGALARNAGHPFRPVPIPSSGGGGGSSALLTFGAPVALIALVGAAVLIRQRHDRDGPGVS